MKHTLYIYMVLLALGMVSASCSGPSSGKQGKKQETYSNAACPEFVADSAFHHVERQCAFGPRMLGTGEADLCAGWIKGKFADAGCSVNEHKTQVTVWDGTTLPCRNIIASTNMEAPVRILLCAHWDSRPWADNDPDSANHRTPILGANDGASGVAVMLEIARAIRNQPLKNVGVDFVCFDAEDMGTPEWAEDSVDDEGESTWCLGSKAWCEEMAKTGYRPRFGILLDMVGGRGAVFAREQVSMHFASDVVSKVWTTAESLGYGQFFSGRTGGTVMDDHVNVNAIMHIPCIDIVPHYVNGPSSFGPTWHTVNDNPENIDPNVLKAVGQTVLQVLYNEDR